MALLGIDRHFITGPTRVTTYMYLSDEVLGDVAGINTAIVVMAASAVLVEVQEPKRSTAINSEQAIILNRHKQPGTTAHPVPPPPPIISAPPRRQNKTLSYVHNIHYAN